LVRSLIPIEAVLVFLEGDNAGSEIRIQSPKEVVLGRSEQCDIFIGEKKVSRKHAKLAVSGEGVYIEDLESTNGTFVDGKKVTRARIRDGDTIRIGMSVFRINLLEGKALSETGDVVADVRKAKAMTVESQPLEIPLKDAEEDEPFDLISNEIEPGVDLGKDMAEADRGLEIAPEPEVKKKSKQAEQKSVEKKKALSGSLSEMMLPDILQMLKNNQRSGVLSVTRDDEDGQVFFIDGKLSAARLGETWGLKAIYRLLCFSEGSFDFQSLSDSFKEEEILEKIDLPLENILLEGMRQIDEFEKIKKGLPPRESEMDINRGSDSPLSKLHPKVLDILQLIISHRKFSRVMDKSPLSDLETGKIIYYLIKKGYVVCS
jgi:pSer/pThr/pTyr-binding forkhead associated (FHA) protein